MPKKKVLAVGVPETLNLKAEIERATAESNKQGSIGNSAARQKDAAKKNRGVHERAQKDFLSHGTQARQPSSSLRAQNTQTKRALEEKARIYDMLSITDDRKKGCRSFLGSAQLDDPYISRILDESSVDFARKQLEQRAEKLNRQTEPQTGSDASARSDSDYSSGFVEIVDEFGRSRMVPRNKAKRYHAETSSDSDSSDENELWSNRDRGTNYYKLDCDRAKRSEQLDILRELHDETLKARENSAGNAVV
ncbi:hypothetical protein LPJ59_002435, partial [Coemansia sp. RSA 2399]